MSNTHNSILGIFFLAAGLAVYGDAPSIVGNGEVVTRQLDLEGFTGLIMRGPFTLKIHKGDRFKVQLAGEANILAKVSMRVAKNSLLVELDGDFTIHEDLVLHVTMPNVHALTLRGRIRAFIDGFKLKTIAIDIIGDATVTTSSTVETLSINAEGRTRFNFEGMEVGTATLNIRGDSETRFADVASLSGSLIGHVTVTYESPKTIDRVDKSGGASVHKAEHSKR